MRALGTRLFLILILLSAAVSGVRGQEFEGKTLVQADLIADTAAIVPGKPFYLGLRMKMAPGWHTYWQYPGDSGIPTSIRWTLPDGFGVGPIEWPIPKAKLEPGDIQVYAYSGEVMLLIPVQPPADLEVGSSVTLQGRATWLVCEAICIPGNGDLSITLPVAATAGPANADVFAATRARIPSADAPPFPVQWSSGADGQLFADVSPGAGISEVEFFPLPAENQPVGHPITTPGSDGSFRIALAAEPPVSGVLVATDASGQRGWMVSSGMPAKAETSEVKSAAVDLPFWQLLFYGFLGGIILNLMPCVLPVISLKVFGFVRQAGESPRHILLHGLAFSGGIFLWFLGLGAVIVALKASGTDVTWAFQFQNPAFILGISALVFLFALNLAGVFEITLPGKTVGAMSELSGREGYSGSFFQGVFATLLATPCTGPFLGTALAVAFAQSGVVIMGLFAAMAFGMAAPYLLLSARPGWMKYLPRPGVWMERLKQFMAFPLFATLIWLFSVLGGQRGVDGIVWAGVFLLFLGIAAWIYGAFCGPASASRSRTIAIAAALLIGVGGGWWAVASGFQDSAEESDQIAWEPFTQARVDALLAEGKPVFIDFTADWCITCKFNERTAINVAAVRTLIRERGIVPIKADWTNSNPEITAALKRFGRVGVPFYVFYPAGKPDQPITLPEILTESMVLEALRN